MHETHEIREPRPASGPLLFKVCGLSYQYPDGTAALSGVSAEIRPGERVALAGQNGSGKTTLIKLLSGLLAPAGGQVRYRDKPLAGENLDRGRLEIGVLFQDPDDQLFMHTIIEDAAFGPRQQGLPQQEAQLAAGRALDRVGLLHLAYKAPHNLSFGQKKRAALAGLLAMEPQVLLLDEPTANLDPGQEQVFLDLLKDFSGTLICISHDLIFLYELCQRAIVLNHGMVQHDYTMRELVSQRRTLREHGLDFSFRLVVAPESPDAGPDDASCRLRPVSAKDPGRALVQLQNYCYRYPDGTPALQGIDLLIRKGERISIVGENGAGKSTLLSCLTGLCQGRGEYLYDGKTVTGRTRKRIWRKIGMVFQDCADQLFCSTVREELSFGLRQLGCTRAETAARVSEALSMVHMEGYEDRVPLHLSGGERRRLALACVLVMEPELLILDEPTAGLDPRGEQLLLDILQKLHTTLLLVSHDIFFIQQLTRRTLVMHQGRIMEDLPMQAFMEDQRLGDLNGLSCMYRLRCTRDIRALQHEHEHTHEHQHLHTHPHRHGDMVHEHLHEHTHTHAHRFVHTHPGRDQSHDHAPRRYHEHDHAGHEAQPHEHMHKQTDKTA